jgi:hypothetical protein
VSCDETFVFLRQLPIKSLGKANRLTSLTDLPEDMLEKINEKLGRVWSKNKVFVPYTGSGSTIAITFPGNLHDGIRGTGTFMYVVRPKWTNFSNLSLEFKWRDLLLVTYGNSKNPY